MRRQINSLAMKSGAGVVNRMMIAIAVASMVIVSSAADAQSQLWGVQYGEKNNERGRAVAPDGSGGVFVGGTADRSPYVGRYDSAGNQNWMNIFRWKGELGTYALAPDGQGGVYAAGRLVIAGMWTGQNGLARYSEAGDRLWALQFGGNGRYEGASGLAPDGTGGVFVCGFTDGDVGGTNAGQNDIYIARYDSTGGQLWVRQFGTPLADYPTGATSDGQGGFLVTGYTQGDLAGPNVGGADVFLARFDDAGEVLWNRQFGSEFHDTAWDVMLDGQGGVFVCGEEEFGVGGFATSTNCFLVKLDLAGNEVWRISFGSRVDDSARSVIPDGMGGVWICGSTNGDLAGANKGGRDAFVARFSSTGVRLWAKQFGTPEDDNARALATDAKGGIFVGGDTSGDLAGASAGYEDSFLIHFGDATCYHADCDQSTGVGVLDMLDFLCFQSAFVMSAPYACQCDTSTGPEVCDVFDFLCFQAEFVAGCQ